jgi:hypothetical protein
MPRTQSPIHESCPACIVGASGGNPHDDLRHGTATTFMYASRGLAGGNVSVKITTPKSKDPLTGGHSDTFVLRTQKWACQEHFSSATHCNKNQVQRTLRSLSITTETGTIFCGPVYVNELRDITNDIGPMLQKNSKKNRYLYWKTRNGVYWIYFPKPFLDPI